ncbi:hypothetical protein ACFX12_006953 [Malus domestica]
MINNFRSFQPFCKEVSSSTSLASGRNSWVERSLTLINVLMISSLLIRDTHVEERCPSVLGGTQMMVDIHRGNKLACLSTPSFVERFKELTCCFELLAHRL